MERLMEQGKSYFSTVERFTRDLPVGGGADGGWDVLNKTFEDMQHAFSGGWEKFAADDSMHRMLGFWEMPLDNWQRMMSSLSPMMPGDMLRNMPHDQVKGGFERMLSAPGLGYTREEQAQYQDLTRRWLDYQSAMQEYMGFFGKLGVKSVQSLKEVIQSRADSDQPIDSGRTLYDSWIGCCEAVYAEEVSTAEYARIHGHLVNAQMALKKRMSVMVDENLGALNMPTRSELRTLQDRVQEARRENKRLRRELDAIKRQLGTAPAVAAAPAETAPAAVTKTPTATAAPKKKAVSKKKAAAKPAAS
jgi:class III poly(R)-hydroxyalkanoic acid synthase PhaE subunit